LGARARAREGALRGGGVEARARTGQERAHGEDLERADVVHLHRERRRVVARLSRDRLQTVANLGHAQILDILERGAHVVHAAAVRLYVLGRSARVDRVR